MGKIAAALAAIFFCACSVVQAWGPGGHSWIHARAFEQLPPELAEFWKNDRDYLVEHASDPDTWRETDPEEHPRHFIDVDRYGSFPFPDLSLDYGEMVKRHGLKKVKDNGTILWTIPEVMRRLEQAFRSGDRAAALREASALGHYVGDLHQPFHAVANYDGQLSGQQGIHGRFEVEVADRVIPTLKPALLALRPIVDPLRESYDIALESFARLNLILVTEWKIVRDLRIDRSSLPRHPEKKFIVYPENYVRELTERTGPVARERLSDAAWSVASFWAQAWRNSR